MLLVKKLSILQQGNKLCEMYPKNCIIIHSFKVVNDCDKLALPVSLTHGGLPLNNLVHCTLCCH